MFNRPDLADFLRRAYDERRNVDYFIDPDNPDLEEFASPEAFVAGTMEEFVERVETLIEDEEVR